MSQITADLSGQPATESRSRLTGQRVPMDRSIAEWRFSDGAFVIAAFLLVFYWALLLTVLVVRYTYVPIAQGESLNGIEIVWAVLLTLLLLWAFVNRQWAERSIHHRAPYGHFVHFSIALSCLLVAVGIHALIWTRAITNQPITIDLTSTVSTVAKPSVQAPASAASTGDAKAGEKLFAMSCVTCHGPGGKGLPNLAPAFVGSPFLMKSDDAAIAAVIRAGRPVGDPSNKSGKVMPARGGNPFLSETDISHLVAYLLEIRSGAASPATGSGDPSTSIQLTRWVVPAAATPPEGMDELRVQAGQRDGLARISLLESRRLNLMRNLSLALGGVHAAMLIGLLAISGMWLLSGLLGQRLLVRPLLGKIALAAWMLAAVAWIPIAALCFGWS